MRALPAAVQHLALVAIRRGRQVRRKGSHRSVSLRLVGFPPTGSHTCWTPWSVFQDGPHGSIAPAASPRRSPEGVAVRRAVRASVAPAACHGGTTPTRVPPAQPLLTSPARCRVSQEPGPPKPAGHSCLPCASPSTISSTFNSLSKVLFIFPSRYLFAIGNPAVFSLGWSLPPVLGLHSQATRLLDCAS